MYPLPRDNRSLNMDWITADVQGLLAGTLVCVLSCVLAAFIFYAVGQAFQPSGDRRRKR